VARLPGRLAVSRRQTVSQSPSIYVLKHGTDFFLGTTSPDALAAEFAARNVEFG
jgi:hypothetical protein